MALCFGRPSRHVSCARVAGMRGRDNSELKIVGTLERTFSLLKRDPILIALFVLPALFPIERILTNFLAYYLVSSIVGKAGEPPSMPPVPFVTLYLIVGFFLGAWAWAAAILKVRELEQGSKLGLREALSKGLKRVPRLLVPAITGLALYTLMIASLTTAVMPYLVIGESALAQDVGPSVIALQVAIGFLFVAGLYVATRLRLAAPACVSEDNFGLATSWKLVRGNWWKLFAILLILGVMSALIGRIPVLGAFLPGLLVEPITITAMTLVYCQLRETKSSQEEPRESV